MLLHVIVHKDITLIIDFNQIIINIIITFKHTISL
jgi:hypothetical protein